jgi:hypothetical protein
MSLHLFTITLHLFQKENKNDILLSFNRLTTSYASERRDLTRSLNCSISIVEQDGHDSYMESGVVLRPIAIAYMSPPLPLPFLLKKDSDGCCRNDAGGGSGRGGSKNLGRNLG